MDIVVPQVGESIFEATVAKWHVADGSQVNKDDLLCELETDKISLELNAEKGGVIHLKAKEGETVEIGAVIATLDESATAGGESAPKQEEKGAEKPPKAGQSAEKPKQKGGEEPADQSAKGGSAEKKQKAEPAEDQPAQPRTEEALPKEPAEPQRKDDPRSRRVTMSSIRKKIAAHLLAARQQTAMLTTFNEADLTRIQELRKKHQDKFQKKHEVKLGLMSFFVRACVEALRDHAEVNARIDGDDIVYQDFYDIGIAIGGEKGLVVPVLRDADELDYAGIEKAIRAYGEKVQKNKLELADLEGGTFTISNGGVYGSMLSTPILNPPQCAVLGMHAIQQRPVVASGKVVVRPMMYLALSYDHRLIDGRQAVGFLKQIKEFIENPDEKLLNL